MAAYTDAATIAAYLATSFTPEQAAQADLAAAAITAWIDHRTGRTWQAAPPTVAAELHPVTLGLVWLAHWPVTSVTAVQARQRGTLDDWTALQDADWYLADPSTGRLELALVGGLWDVLVDYATATAGVPADLAQAATALAADLLYPTLHPEASGVESLAVGQNDISIRYATASGGGQAASASGPTAAAVAVVDSYRRVVLA